MEEIKRLTLPAPPFQILGSQFVIFCKQDRQVFFGQCVRLRSSHNRLHGNLFSDFRHLQHFLRKMRTEMRVCPTQIVIPAPAAFDNLFKTAHRCIIAAGLIWERTHGIMHFLTAVKAQHDHDPVIVQELYDFII